jgi:hypothetical protein
MGAASKTLRRAREGCPNTSCIHHKRSRHPTAELTLRIVLHLKVSLVGGAVGWTRAAGYRYTMRWVHV